MQRPRSLLAATLIVRDEAHQLADCLQTLSGVVDEIVVYDTGSRDGTRELARAAGARVLAGYWDGDFSRARNIALEMTRARWALAVDADERLVADAAALRGLLDGGRTAAPDRPGRTRPPGAAGFLLHVVSRDREGRFQAGHHSLRIVRPQGARWSGRVHEVLRPDRHNAPRVLLPEDVVRVEHLGYADEAAVRAKAERNLALAQAELDRLFTSRSEDRETGSRVLLDLARSAVELGRRQLAVDALEVLREITPAGVQRAQGTSLLAQVLLDAGGFEEIVLALETELRGAEGVDGRLADWLRAQAVAGLGRPLEALALLRGIDRLVDPAGVELPLRRVLGARAALAARLGLRDEARSVLLDVVLDHGIVTGSRELLHGLFTDRPETLAAALDEARASGRDRWVPTLRAELQALAQGAGTVPRPR